MIRYALTDHPDATEANAILYKLAEALGYWPVLHDDGTRTITIEDPDELVEDACRAIWQYQDLADS